MRTIEEIRNVASEYDEELQEKTYLPECCAECLKNEEKGEPKINVSKISYLITEAYELGRSESVPLVWEEGEEDSYYRKVLSEKASVCCLLLEYVVEKKDIYSKYKAKLRFGWIQKTEYEFSGKEYDTIDEAKQACQSHYDRM